jgi:hypothetical protein
MLLVAIAREPASHREILLEAGVGARVGIDEAAIAFARAHKTDMADIPSFRARNILGGGDDDAARANIGGFGAVPEAGMQLLPEDRSAVGLGDRTA